MGRMRRLVVGAAIAGTALAPGGVAAVASGAGSIKVDAKLTVRDIRSDVNAAGYLVDPHLGTGVVDYRADRSGGTFESFRVYYKDGYLNVKLTLTYAPTTIVGTGTFAGGSGRYKNARGKLTSVAGSHDGDTGYERLKLKGTLKLP